MSSVLFIEQPAGVGFSYAVNGSTTTDDYVQSQNTSPDLHTTPLHARWDATPVKRRSLLLLCPLPLLFCRRYGFMLNFFKAYPEFSKSKPQSHIALSVHPPHHC